MATNARRGLLEELRRRSTADFAGTSLPGLEQQPSSTLRSDDDCNDWFLDFLTGRSTLPCEGADDLRCVPYRGRYGGSRLTGW